MLGVASNLVCSSKCGHLGHWTVAPCQSCGADACIVAGVGYDDPNTGAFRATVECADALIRRRAPGMGRLGMQAPNLAQAQAAQAQQAQAAQAVQQAQAAQAAQVYIPCICMV